MLLWVACDLLAAVFIRTFLVWRTTFEKAPYNAPIVEKLESVLDIIDAPPINITMKTIALGGIEFRRIHTPNINATQGSVALMALVRATDEIESDAFVHSCPRANAIPIKRTMK